MMKNLDTFKKSKFITKCKEIYNKFVRSVGSDRILHFTINALVVAYAIPYGHIAVILAFIFIILLSLFKEIFMDKFDFWDMLADWLGCMLSFIMYGIAANLFHLVL